MGLDFIAKCADTFVRSWDRGRKDLAEPNLFTDIPKSERQTFIAVARQGHKFMHGKWYEVGIEKGAAVIRDELTTIGDLRDLPEKLLNTISTEGCGIAAAYTNTIHEVSNAADVTLR